MKIKNHLIFVLLACQLSVADAFAQDVVISKVKGAKEELVLSLLELVISKTDPAAKVNQLDQEIPMSRQVEETNAGGLDLLWAGSSAELDRKLLAVRIPLLKGLLGHRIFIIREGDQRLFDDVYSLDDLKQLKAGMGRFWGSTKVLIEAGLPVVSTRKYKNLFYMLDGGRFDYFPRAAHEPWSEVADRPDLNLGVEKRILLIYPYAMYFYVGKTDLEMHARLTQGLEMAIADGSFDALFFSNSMVRAAVEKTNFRERIVMRIDNPAMHPDTPLDRPALWLDIENL